MCMILRAVGNFFGEYLEHYGMVTYGQIIASKRSERADLVVSRAEFVSISTGAAYSNVLRNSKYA